jgi:spore germination protein YaaH
MLAYFAYKVDPSTGEQKHDIQWETASVIDSAKDNNCKVYLTIENFGHTNNLQFFQNKKAQKTLIKNSMKMVTQREVSGICIDFEEIPDTMKKAYNDFLIDLSHALKKLHMELIVVLQLYEPQNQVDPLQLADAIDYYIMMGYACYHLGSSHAGPISPLRSGDIWEPYSLEPNINAYLKAQFPADKFMVALPLYGGRWETETDKINSKSIKGISSPTVNSAIKNASGPILIDSISESTYYIYEVDGKTQQCWFEGKHSMTIKMQYIKDKGLAGIGL